MANARAAWREKAAYWHLIDGLNFTEIGERVGVSRERVRQVIREAGIAPDTSTYIRSWDKQCQCAWCGRMFERHARTFPHTLACSKECSTYIIRSRAVNGGIHWARVNMTRIDRLSVCVRFAKWVERPWITHGTAKHNSTLWAATKWLTAQMYGRDPGLDGLWSTVINGDYEDLRWENLFLGTPSEVHRLRKNGDTSVLANNRV